ncbi:hypothetical protein ISN44_As10g032750 [Arabidopsis suecica]|uniref:Uncharacterized protein n=1 Tax=Arabidopsis suecica TaxID=45249 RepID=A0A8T2A5D9_ARASU|nr:hypothetical protein ISN44_As10g032750 [Arabidopsis suecica]
MAFSKFRKQISTAHPILMTFSSPRHDSSSSTPPIGNHINGGMGLRSMSEESLNKLTDCINNMNEDVSKLYMECPETDFNTELLNLLNDYFNTSGEVTELCKSLRKCLETAQHYECAFIEEALYDFEEEKRIYGGRLLLEASFRKTLGDLRSFSEFDYFNDGDLERKAMRCRDEIAHLIVKLNEMVKKIDEDLKRVRLRRAVVAVALLVPVIGLLATKLVGGVPIESLTTYAASKWRKATKGLKMKKIAMVSMERGMTVALKEVEIIVKLVMRLRHVERLIREKAKFAVDKQFSVAEVMGGMEKEQKMMKSTLVDLDREAGRCDDLAQFGRNTARMKVVEFLSPD